MPEQQLIQKKDIKCMEDQGDVKRLILALKHSDAELRSAAASALCKVGDEQAVESLIEALLTDEAWVVRRYAAEALGKIGSEQVVEPLTVAVNEDPFVCQITGRRVVRMVAEEALKDIENAKTATEPLDRVLACQWSESSQSENVKMLIEILRRHCRSIEDRDVSKCTDAICKLAKEEDPIISEVMCYVALSALHFNVRDSAAHVLKGTATPDITQILCDALQYDRKAGPPVQEALEALLVIGDQRAAKPIAEFLDEFRIKWRMGNDTIVAGMSSITLAAYLDQEKSICISACRALATLGGAEAINAMEAVLRDDYWRNYREIQEELPKCIAQAKDQ